MKWIQDLRQFIVAVVLRWQAYVTGGLLAAAAFIYEHLTNKMIPASVVLWGIGAFFVTGAFGAWREQRSRVEQCEARRPEFCYDSDHSVLSSNVRIHNGKPVVWLDAHMRFRNCGDTAAFNPRFKTYFAWLPELSQLFDISGETGVWKFGPGQHIGRRIYVYRPARNLGLAGLGLNSDDQLI